VPVLVAALNYDELLIRGRRLGAGAGRCRGARGRRVSGGVEEHGVGAGGYRRGAGVGRVFSSGQRRGRPPGCSLVVAPRLEKVYVVIGDWIDQANPPP
jgi:hypothetical protein